MKLVQVQKASLFFKTERKTQNWALLKDKMMHWVYFRCQPETTNESELDEEIKGLKAELEEQIRINQICKFNNNLPCYSIFENNKRFES